MPSGSTPSTEERVEEKVEEEEKEKEEEEEEKVVAPAKDYGVELNSYIVLNECM